jgi:hypothetical protein
MEFAIGSTMMRVNGQARPIQTPAGIMPAISREGRLFVPISAFEEVFGVRIQWNEATRTLTVNP